MGRIMLANGVPTKDDQLKHQNLFVFKTRKKLIILGSDTRHLHQKGWWWSPLAHLIEFDNIKFNPVHFSKLWPLSIFEDWPLHFSHSLSHPTQGAQVSGVSDVRKCLS